MIVEKGRFHFAEKYFLRVVKALLASPVLTTLSANYSFYLLCVMASFLMKKVFLYFNCIFFLHGKCFD